MPFGDEYWLVHHPDLPGTPSLGSITKPTFLLLTIRGPGAALRHYDANRRVYRVSVSRDEVLRKTSQGTTRFSMQDHRTDDWAYWYDLIATYNIRYLNAKGYITSPQVSGPPRPAATRGRATRGSRWQIQTYVNGQPNLLDNAIVAQLPQRLQDSNPRIEWVSPLAHEDYAEYRDSDFLDAVGLSKAAGLLAGFWPKNGPSWDALAIVRTPGFRDGIILVEAKSYPEELYGNGCQAGDHSRVLVENSLARVKAAYSARSDADWTGRLYQLANRLAHLWFLRSLPQDLSRPVWLVNLCFLGDPIRPTAREQFESHVAAAWGELGLPAQPPSVFTLFLPALSAQPGQDAPARRDPMPQPSRSSTPDTAGTKTSRAAASNPFPEWVNQWMELATFQGAELRDAAARVERIIRLWKNPIPGTWARSASDIPSRLLTQERYTRGDRVNPHAGEHRIEYEILITRFDSVRLRGDPLIDGVNAFPLVRDAGGGRGANVEADLLLIFASGIAVGEVKNVSSNPWYAAVENLLQVKLARSSDWVAEFCRGRTGVLAVGPPTGLVIAPEGFYSAAGQKRNSLSSAQMLARMISVAGDVPLRLLTWNSRTATLNRLD